MTEQTSTLWADEAETHIAADASTVWRLVSDIPLMGRWSPVCRRCDYLDGATAAAEGTRFVGYNRLAGARWTRTCVVTACEPAHELAFHTLFNGEIGTRWRYLLEPNETGTRVVESYELLAMPRWGAGDAGASGNEATLTI